MMKKALALSASIIIIVLCFSCTQRITSSDNKSVQQKFIPEQNGYKLIWMDNFDGTKLDMTKWQYRLTGRRRIGYNDPSMVKVVNGKLMLMYNVKGDSILAGMIGTQSTFMNSYGYYECRARLQRGKGPWSAFWMQSPVISKGSDPGEYGTEIDIFEYFRELGLNVLTHCLHWAYGPHMQSSNRLISHVRGLSRGFHTFGLEWTKNKYSFYIDGIKYHEKKIGLSHIKEYMILSIEIPDKREKVKEACVPDTFMVDYVKVYRKIGNKNK